MMLYCFGFALLRCVIGPENSRHNLNQSNVKLKLTRVFPRLKEVGCFYSEFSLANNHGNLFSDWKL